MMLAAVLAFAVGAVLAWLVAGAAAKSRTAAAEARVEELRGQVDAARQGFDGLRAKLEESERAKVEAETRVAELGKRFVEQQALLDKAKQDMSDAFSALASKALADNNKGFLTLAEQQFKALKDGAETDLATRQQAIDSLVKPLEKALTDYQKEARELEEKRLREIGSVGNQLTTLQHVTAKLAGTLASGQIRGRWGEQAVRRCLELAGLTEGLDFWAQSTQSTDDGHLRPDFGVKLPGDREVIIDVKVPSSGYDAWTEAQTDSERMQALTRHVASLKKHINDLSDKEYWKRVPSAEFVVMVIPNDTFLAAGVEADASLVEFAMGKRVIIVTPFTLYGLLRAVERGWQQQKLTENARRVWEEGQKLCDRIATFADHVKKMGAGLRTALKSYGNAEGSFNRMLMPQVVRFQQLGIGTGKDIKELPVLDVSEERSEDSSQTETEPIEGHL